MPLSAETGRYSPGRDRKLTLRKHRPLYN